MRVVRHLSDLPAALRGGAVAIGNFDGVHRGHQAVIEAARSGAGNGACIALTFEPHPRTLFRPSDPPFRLTPLRAKLQQFAALGLDAAVVLAFTPVFAALDAAAFVEKVLVSGLAARQVVIGADFCFGRGRSGTADWLAGRAAAAGFAVTSVPPQVGEDGAVFSSTSIRDHLTAGEPRQAMRLLGRPFTISGRVKTGDRRGRLLGFPTANIGLADLLRPRAGVYAVRVEVPGRSYGGVANIGDRPTVDGRDFRLEVNLFDFSGDLYGRRLDVALLDFIRPEMRFPGLDALKAQIAQDAGTARSLLSAATVTR